MIINKHGTDGVKVLKPEIFKDKRGYFYEAFNENKLSKLLKKKISIKQSNISFSKKNVFRGFHFQEKNHAQEKFVRVLSGKILDIIININKNSKNYLKTFQYELSDINKKILYVPKDFAHGFLVLSKNATIEYFVTSYYSKKSEKNISIFDKRLRINKKILKKKFIISKKNKISNV